MKTGEDHKFALVTGGNSGIGYATAKLLKKRGYEVTITGRDLGRVSEAAQKLGVEFHIADIGSFDAMKELASKFHNTGLDVLVNNAAIARFIPITAHTGEDYREFLDCNIHGPMLLIQGLIPALEKRNGAITSISSAITQNGLPNASLYAATKGALEAMSKSLAIELAPLGIRANVVSPGAIDTPILNKLGLTEEQVSVIKSQQETQIPMNRYGNAFEVADVIVAQLEASYVTGALWTVDGGIDAM
ncbi:MAG: SDR family NAD(P)-dependent oxidoreductase [Proteobacteria bacterium]|nr:SDR family NAD(P)-dependent oxidoreductase [Pseudomonadota bacterium]